MRRLKRPDFFSLAKRRQRSYVTAAHSYLKGSNKDPKRKLFLVLVDNITRVTTMVWEVQVEHEEKFFQYKVVQHWSRLPAEAVNPSPLGDFSRHR